MVLETERTSWGIIYNYSYPPYFRFSLYIYSDDPNVLYLSNVCVSHYYRGRGFGNKLIEFVFKESKKLGEQSIRLKVLRESFMYDWYSREGFTDLCDDEEDEKYIWMKLLTLR